jgi:predicted exporter
MKKQYALRWSLAGLILLSVAGLFIAGVYRLQFSTDILATLPQNDPVLADARYVLMHNPAMEKIVIDISLERQDVPLLTDCAAFVEARLRESGLFKQVGLEHMTKLMPGFLQYAAGSLPVLFSERALAETVAPLLSPDKVREVLASHLAGLSGMEGIGQAELMARDPLNLRNIVLARMARLIPVKNARFVKGQPMSSDGRHLLIIAEPAGSGTDTAFARRLDAVMQQTAGEVAARYGAANTCRLTPVGSYRTSLDNEENAKRTVQRATLFSTIAIALLLLGAFPRPLIGLLALLPAFAGTMFAVFVYSLFNRSISLLAVGFGGAIVSFTVDYGIAYLLFLDRRHETKGFAASRQVWSLGLIAMLTTAVSFAALSLSGFPALAEIGLFSSMGVVFTYVFVHAIFPLVFASMPAAGREPFVPLQAFVNRIASSRNSWKAPAAIAFSIIMLFFARPEFHIDLTALNAASPQTLAAETLVQQVWGDVSGSMQLMLESGSRDELSRRGDRVSRRLEAEIAGGAVQPCFLPSSLLPGAEARRENFAAWQRFWSAERIAGLETAVGAASRDLGFAPDAFAPFFTMLRSPAMPQSSLPDELCSMLGISTSEDRSLWRQVLALAPGPSYIAEDFYSRMSADAAARLFDPTLFSQRLGTVLLSGFVKMALIVSLVTILVAFFYFMDWQLALLGIAPTLFALICTLGTLKIMGQPLGIPMLMVTVVVIGMGTDYALYLIRAYQRYFDDYNASLGLIRLSVFLSFATTLLGFGVLAVCDNPMLKSAGLGLALGIGYSFIGAVTIVPPVLARLFAPAHFADAAIQAGSRQHFQRFLSRYRHMEAYPRFFARFKVLCDPMFPRLAGFLHDPRTVIDIGTGYGAPAAWLLELFPRAQVFGIEPDEGRARIASRVIGSRGAVQVGRAPEIPAVPEPADCALLLDMLHYVTDDEVRLTLSRLRDKLCPGSALIVRVTIPARDRAPVQRFIETTRLKVLGIVSFFRTAQQVRALITDAGFTLTCEEPTAAGREEIWFIAER